MGRGRSSTRGCLKWVGVGLHEALVQGLEDQGRPLVEASPGFVHGDAEAFVLAAGQAAAEAKQRPASRLLIQEGHLGGGAVGVVPGHDDGARAQLDPLGQRPHLGEPLDVVRRYGVAEEVMLRRPVAVEAELLGGQGELQLSLEHLAVFEGITIVLKDAEHSNVH